MKQFPRRFWLVLALLLLPMAQAGAAITAVKYESLAQGGERLRFESSESITPRRYLSLGNPERIVIDIPATHAKGVTLPKSYRGNLLKAIRIGQFDAETTRIVLDLRRPARVKALTPGKPFTVELAAGKEVAKDEDDNDPNASDDDSSPPPVRGRQGGGRSLAPCPECPHPNPPLIGEGAKKKPLIAIDAGHGGQDPGALGLHDTQERDVTLNFARTLANALEKTGRYRAKLTRTDDTYILLHERVNIARRAKADLLISLHADSNPRPEARGLSLYTLSATASDDEAAALAERENKSDIITGLDLNTTDQDVANILIDLTQRETMNKSTTLADGIVASLDPKINRLPATHRFAGFRVLKAPDVPSVLIELGFLSNATDERLLLTAEYRDVVIASIIKGIDKFYAESGRR